MAFTCASTTSRTSTQPKDVDELPCFMCPSSKLRISLIDSESFLLEAGGPTVKPGNMKPALVHKGVRWKISTQLSQQVFWKERNRDALLDSVLFVICFSAIGADKISIAAFRRRCHHHTFNPGFAGFFHNV